MRRTTILVEDRLFQLVRRYAARHGKSFAQVVREALVAYTEPAAARAARLPRLAGRFASGHRDTADRVDELLWREPHR